MDRVLPLSVLLAGFLAMGCDSPGRGTPPDYARDAEIRIDNVILISIDSLRADHLGAYGYRKDTSPHLDALAENGLLFERAYSTTSWTLPSHTALFTGLDDRAHGVRHHKTRLVPAISTLAEELTKGGVHTVGFYSGPYLHPTFGLARGFSEYRNCSSVVPKAPKKEVGLQHFASFKDVTNPIILGSVRGWLDEKSYAKRNFIFIHMWDVHYDYAPPQKYIDMFDPGYRGGISGGVYRDDSVHAGMDARDLQHLIARYDGEIRYTDDTIAEVLDLLGGAGLTGNSAIIVVSDHGDEFFEHGGKGHQHTLFNELLHIPMIVHLPGQQPVESRIDRVVSLVDVYPTVCELLGVSCDMSGRSGESLVPFLREGNAHPSRNRALADLFNRSTGTHQDALVLPDGKALRWETVSADFTRDWVRGMLPEQPIPESADTVAVYFEGRGIEGDRGAYVSSGESSGAGGRALSLLTQASQSASQSRKTLVGDSGEAETSIDDETKERLRALGYME